MRRWWFFAQGALVAALAVLAFPGASSALEGTYTVSLTSSGPSPATLTRVTGYARFVIRNTDTVTHTIAFANGLCSEQIAASGAAHCDFTFLDYAGTYAYTVDGSTQANVLVEAVGRRVTLTARSHAIRRGSVLRLRGRLEAYWPGGPPGAGVPQPVLILSRPGPSYPYHRVAVVRARWDKTRRPGAPVGEVLWHLRTRPKAGTVYTAEAVYQPAGGRIWTQAFSTPFRVQLHR